VDLRSSQPWWLLRNGISANYPPLAESLACDVAIVGAGITGALLADRLSAAGRSVVVLDRRSAGEGSTAASTALLQYEVDQPLHRLEALIGEHGARRAYELGVEAIATLESLSRHIACGFARRRSLQLASRRAHMADLRQEFARRSAIGLGCRLRSSEELLSERGIVAAGGLENDVAAEVDPFRLTHALLRQALGRGARVHDRTLVTAYASDAQGVTLSTDRSHHVRAQRVVFATGYETLEFGPPVPVALSSTYCLVTDPIADLGRWHDRALLWETARPYFYLRTTIDQRMIIGGGDIPTANPSRRDALIGRKAGQLAGRLRRLFPEMPFDVAFAWAGCFAETPDGLPLIGAAEGFPHALFALGYGGNGITFSVIAADILAAELLGGRHPDFRVFALDRPSLRTSKARKQSR
jgi:glycine/D-amino acid oxidase-like deaminating enzyme